MSDFDFDELDKAVAGALPASDTPDEDADTERASGSPARPASEASSERSVPAREETPEDRTAAPAVRRGSGRFMDVVHPSSDMRTKNTAFTPPSRSSQEVTRPNDSSRAESSASSRVNEPDSPETETQDAWNQPLESPFLPDAKVEKRPLGAFADSNNAENDTSTSELLAEEPDELLLEAPDDPRLEATAMPDPIDFAAHASALPAESEDTGVSQPEAPEAQPAKSESYAASTEDTSVENTPGGTSISQQYTEQPSSAPSSGAVYDTENYHQPLPAATKKHSGVWVFIWILLLVILGAGAGVAFYLFVLPMF